MADAGPPPRGVRSTQFRVGGETYVVVSFPDRASDPLTAAEREVVQHALDGATTAAIAVTRGTSVRTVGKQLESAYRKLGVRSRGELAARVGTP